ncbi:MAG: Arc family DNA-binding protein [Xylophilus ampelinus]
MEPKQQPPYPLRMPQEMRAQLEVEAAAEKRSLNAHILVALQERQSLQLQVESLRAELAQAKLPTGWRQADPMNFDAVRDMVENMAWEWKCTPEEALLKLVLRGAANGGQLLYVRVAPGMTVGDIRTVMNAARREAEADAHVIYSQDRRATFDAQSILKRAKKQLAELPPDPPRPTFPELGENQVFLIDPQANDGSGVVVDKTVLEEAIRKHASATNAVEEEQRQPTLVGNIGRDQASNIYSEVLGRKAKPISLKPVNTGPVRSRNAKSRKT